MNVSPGSPGSSPLQQIVDTKQPRGWLPRGYIDGLVLSNDATDATNDIAISAGVCRSTFSIVGGAVSTLTRDQIDLEIPASVIKQLDVSWAPAVFGGGGRSGMRMAGAAISDTTWHICVVGAPGKPCDVLAVNNASAVTATLVAELSKIGYTAFRRVGSIIRASSAILAFTQTADDFFRYVTPPAADIADTGLSTTSTDYTLTVPLGSILRVLLNLEVGVGSGARNVYLRTPSDTDSAPSNTATPLATIICQSAGIGGQQATVYTNTSAQISARSDGASTTLRGVVLGWWDTRGRNS